jgi:uncharacterized protein
MPIIQSTYTAPLLFRNYHISTIYASTLRRVSKPLYSRERLELPDGDFLDLDWSMPEQGKCKKVAIILHGLEGNSTRPYVKGMTNHFNNNGWEVAAVNLRGCSGELNRLYRSYNAGASEDLEQVVDHIQGHGRYSEIVLVGFSLGGNLMLKYLGEGRKLPQQIKAAVAISTPCDLYRSLLRLQEPKNFLYSRRFVKKLKKQLLLRETKFPEKLTRKEIAACRTLYSIDDLYTGKAHGFRNAKDYYEKSSAINFIPNIQIPTLLINAKNDAFLSENSSPADLAARNPSFFLEMPKHGGHVGFLQNKEQTYTEERALEFISERIYKNR